MRVYLVGGRTARNTCCSRLYLNMERTIRYVLNNGHAGHFLDCPDTSHNLGNHNSTRLAFQNFIDFTPR